MTGSREPLSPCVSFLRERQSDCVHCRIRASALLADLAVADPDQRLKTVRNGSLCGASYGTPQPTSVPRILTAALHRAADVRRGPPRATRLCGT